MIYEHNAYDKEIKAIPIGRSMHSMPMSRTRFSCRTISTVGTTKNGICRQANEVSNSNKVSDMFQHTKTF